MELNWRHDPVIRTKVLLQLKHLLADSEEVKQAQAQLLKTELVHQLLTDQNEHGVIPFHPYDKWFGAHWVLACLADLSYPTRDKRLYPFVTVDALGVLKAAGRTSL